jgi:hypothetical protein
MAEADMPLELEGNLIVERPPARRWISVVAVVVPVIAFVGLSAWFIRVFIAPPMIAIPASPQVASAAPEPNAPATFEARSSAESPAAMAANEPATGPASILPDMPAAEAAKADPAPQSLPMFASLAVAPPSFESSAVAAEPAQGDTTPAEAEPDAAIEPSEPIPLPRPKPRFTVAAIAGPVPLPTPRPTESAPPPPPDYSIFQRGGPE